MRYKGYDTGGKPLSLGTARPDRASEACRHQTKVTYVIAHRYYPFRSESVPNHVRKWLNFQEPFSLADRERSMTVQAGE